MLLGSVAVAPETNAKGGYLIWFRAGRRPAQRAKGRTGKPILRDPAHRGGQMSLTGKNRSRTSVAPSLVTERPDEPVARRAIYFVRWGQYRRSFASFLL